MQGKANPRPTCEVIGETQILDVSGVQAGEMLSEALMQT